VYGARVARCWLGSHRLAANAPCRCLDKAYTPDPPDRPASRSEDEPIDPPGNPPGRRCPYPMAPGMFVPEGRAMATILPLAIGLARSGSDPSSRPRLPLHAVGRASVFEIPGGSPVEPAAPEDGKHRRQGTKNGRCDCHGD